MPIETITWWILLPLALALLPAAAFAEKRALDP